jgi:lipopolysaccharide transport system ATP-binding protein
MATAGNSPEWAIITKQLGKTYPIWSSRHARLKSLLWQFAYRVFPLQKLGLPAEEEKLAHYGHSFKALSGVNLNVHRGECIGIIGKNGSGKSTLLQLLSGILTPSNGTMKVHGKVAALLELGSGFNDEFTGRENVFLNAAIYGNSRQQTEAVFDKITQFADIGEFMDQKVKTYSSGMVVRLAFSVLAHLKPDVLIIDEALAVGDAFFVQKCMRWLQTFVKSNTVVMVSHDMGAITRFCDRVMWLDQGKVRYTGDPKRATELYLQSHYEDPLDIEETEDDAVTKEDIVASDRSPITPRDIRQEALLASGDTALPFFNFTEDSPHFGEGKVRVVKVGFCLLPEDEPASVVHGGELVRVSVTILAKAEITSPIVGFGIKNRLGQELFHDNTYLSSHLFGKTPLTLLTGETAVAEFEFVMPYLPSGDHFLFAAVAVGSHDEHTQQHWLHEAIKIQPVSDRIVLGLLGLPMQNIRFEKSTDDSK